MDVDGFLVVFIGFPMAVLCGNFRGGGTDGGGEGAAGGGAPRLACTLIALRNLLPP